MWKQILQMHWALPAELVMCDNDKSIFVSVIALCRQAHHVKWAFTTNALYLSHSQFRRCNCCVQLLDIFARIFLCHKEIMVTGHLPQPPTNSYSSDTKAILSLQVKADHFTETKIETFEMIDLINNSTVTFVNTTLDVKNLNRWKNGTDEWF